MRALSRTVAAIALGLPLMVAGSAMANASMPMSHHKPHHHKIKIDLDVDQDLLQAAHQSNATGPVNTSGNNNKFVTSQENEALQSATQNAFSE